MSDWHSVDEQMPPNDRWVQVKNANSNWTAKKNGNWWVYWKIPTSAQMLDRMENPITHWRYIEDEIIAIY